MNLKSKLTVSVSTILLICGCSGGSTYEKAIANFVQTDKKGVWTDLQFKVIEMANPVDITVGDSIRILTDVFEADKAKKMEFANEGILRNKKSLEKETLPTMKKFHQQYIDKNQRYIDSLSTIVVSLPESYKGKAVTDVLAKEIVCKFSIVPPMHNSRQEMTATFILNAEGNKCYHRIK